MQDIPSACGKDRHGSDWVVPFYHNKAFPVGIIEGHAQDTMLPWLCSKSIGLCFTPNEHNFAVRDFGGVEENITNRLIFTVHRE